MGALLRGLVIFGNRGIGCLISKVKERSFRICVFFLRVVGVIYFIIDWFSLYYSFRRILILMIILILK